VRVQEDFELLDRGWRAAILRWRVTAGALLLSSPEVSLGEAARLAGYSSLKAMARAFSDEGLPSPSEVRERIGKDSIPAGESAG
jgi:transcriptional regulator GlxA family with amidase domain